MRVVTKKRGKKVNAILAEAKNMPTVKVEVDKKLFDLVNQRLPGLGYETAEDFVNHAVELRFEALLGLIAKTKS